MPLTRPKKVPTANLAQGSSFLTSLPAGSVLQVVHRDYNPLFSTSSTSFVDITNFNVTITPSSTSSKILCIVSSPSWYVANNASYITIYRDSTDLGNSTYGLMRNDNTASNSAGATNQVIDSPNTTSATEYSVYHRTSNGDQNYICYSSYGYLTLTVMEISA